MVDRPSNRLVHFIDGLLVLDEDSLPLLVAFRQRQRDDIKSLLYNIKKARRNLKWKP